MPEPVLGALYNCGGTNWDTSRFAGHLLDEGLTEDRFIAICHALIFRTGVRRTTQRARNTSIFRRLLDEGALPDKRVLRVLDVGPSGGLDSLATFELLKTRYEVADYVLADLYTHVLFDRERGLVFDQDEKLLQIRRRGSFVATGFEHNYAFQKVTSFPKRLRPWLLERRYAFEHGRAVERIPLVHPSLRVDAAGSPFRLQRMDVFDPLPKAFASSFDLVVCMHLLVPRYFSAERIDAGVRNLTEALAPGGTLVVGAIENYRVLGRDGAGAVTSRHVVEARP